MATAATTCSLSSASRTRAWRRQRANRASVAAIALTAALSCGSGNAQQCTPDVLSQYEDVGWPTQLDVGLYWFGFNDQFEKARSDRKSQFYDRTKPTMLYFHGWSGENGGSVSKCQRLTTVCPPHICPASAGSNNFLTEAWLTKGWNVGFFYWDQFADEDCQRDSEQKVWFDKDGKGLRWKSFDVGAGTHTWERYTGKELSVAELASKTIADAMADYAGGHVRFVGHDIGAQLAAFSASLLHAKKHRAAPVRLSLLEPFFTRYHLKFLRCKELTASGDRGIGSFAEQATTEAVANMWRDHGVVTEIYKSSEITQNAAFGLTSKELSRLGTLVIYDPTWCGSAGSASHLPAAAQSVLEAMGKGPNLQCYHTAMIPLYFLHFGLAASPLETPQTAVGSVAEGARATSLAIQKADVGSALHECATPYAGCTDLELREWVQRQHNSAVAGAQMWTQQAGKETFTVDDDKFLLLPDLSVAPELVVQDASMLYAGTLLARDPGPTIDIYGFEFPVPRWHIWQVALVGAGIGLLCFLVSWLIIGGHAAALCAEDDASDEENGSSSAKGARRNVELAGIGRGGDFPEKRSFASAATEDLEENALLSKR